MIYTTHINLRPITRLVLALNKGAYGPCYLTNKILWSWSSTTRQNSVAVTGSRLGGVTVYPCIHWSLSPGVTCKVAPTCGKKIKCTDR
jgi:hypothetical protein